MKKRTKLTIVLVSSVLTMLTSTSILYSQSNIPKVEVETAFKELKNELTNSTLTGSLVAEGGGIGVTYERLLFYKRNAELLNYLQDKNIEAQHMINDEEILNELIATDLSVKYAKDIGLTVSEEEINEVIKLERSALAGNESENNLVKELMAQRIKMTGLTEDEFWNRAETRYNYEKAILLGKLASRLIEEGTIEFISDLSKFQLELLNKNIDKIKVNDSLLAVNR